MRLGSYHIPATIFAGIALLAAPSPLRPQEPGHGLRVTATEAIPDAPRPQIALASVEPFEQQAQGGQSQNAPQPTPNPAPAQNPAAQGSSSSQTPAPQTGAEKSQHDKAEDQMREQEHQRVVGVLPQFNISYRSDAVSMTASQKIRLAFRSAVDPVAFALPFLVAGYHEAMDDDTGFGWGIEGYGKRSGAAYLDSFDGNMISNGFLPAILHQDPRYFRLGHGTVTHRLLYSLASNVICKHDNTGKWEPNYSTVGGNLISGVISNLYYPSSDSGIGQTFTNGFIVTAEGGVGAIFDEFWPDVSRKLFHKDPTRGLDAQVRAQDAAEKQAAKEAKEKAKPNQQ
jgi:hypothetical protein